MLWDYWVLIITDIISLTFVLLCFIAQMHRINTGGIYSVARIYFAVYLVFFCFQALFHFFRDLEFDHTMQRDATYLMIDRIILLLMTAVAFKVYQMISQIKK